MPYICKFPPKISLIVIHEISKRSNNLPTIINTVFKNYFFIQMKHQQFQSKKHSYVLTIISKNTTSNKDFTHQAMIQVLKNFKILNFNFSNYK